MSKPKKLAKIIPFSARRKHAAKRKVTKLEKEVYAMLKAEKIPFTKEKAIGRCHVDVFIEPNVIVEIQGCYWHKHECSRPKAGWSEEDRAMQERDANRFAFFKSKGYQVIQVWECELERDPEWVRSLLRGAYTPQSRRRAA